MINILAYISLVLIFVSKGLVGGAQPLVQISSGIGASSQTISVWRTCQRSSTTAGTDDCFSVTSNRQCSELSSRMKVVGAFSILCIVAAVLNFAVIAGETCGTTFPVRHLAKICFGWSLLPLIIACSLVIGTLVARLCNDPTPLADTNGAFGPGFYMMCAGVLCQIAALGLYLFWDSKRHVDSEGTDGTSLSQQFNSL